MDGAPALADAHRERLQRLQKVSVWIMALGALLLVVTRVVFNRRFVGPVPILAFWFVPLIGHNYLKVLVAEQEARRRAWVSFAISTALIVALLVLVAIPEESVPWLHEPLF